jgi:hypothetical protein
MTNPSDGGPLLAAVAALTPAQQREYLRLRETMTGREALAALGAPLPAPPPTHLAPPSIKALVSLSREGAVARRVPGTKTRIWWHGGHETVLDHVLDALIVRGFVATPDPETTAAARRYRITPAGRAEVARRRREAARRYHLTSED